MAHIPLEVVDTLPAITEVATATYCNEIPGFQVREGWYQRLGLVPILDTIEAVALETMEEPVPFTYLPMDAADAGRYAPHIDAGFRGLSIHANRRGRGLIELAHYLDDAPLNRTLPEMFRKDKSEPFSMYSGLGIDQACDDVDHGQVYSGELVPKRLTIFSEGQVGNLIPVIHYFKRVGRGNLWSRYASSQTDGNLSSAELAELVKVFRNRQILSDYNTLQTDKNSWSIYETFAKPAKGMTVHDLSETGMLLEEIEQMLETHPGKELVSAGTGAAENSAYSRSLSRRRF